MGDSSSGTGWGRVLYWWAGSSHKSVPKPVDPAEMRGLYFNARAWHADIEDLPQHLTYREGVWKTHPGKPVAF